MLIMNEHLHFILQGYWFSELYRLEGFFDRVHIAESKPVKYGQAFRNVDPSIVIMPGQYSKDAYKGIVLENIEYRKFELQQILS